MNPLIIDPINRPLCATVSIPGSKSYTNRALIMAALTKGPVSLQSPLYSEDTEAMISCLKTLGLAIETTANAIVVQNDISSIEDKYYRLYAHDSGTTVRFLLALLCLVPGVKILEGSLRLNERPIGDLVDSLRQLGAVIEYCGQEGQLPLKISSSMLTGHEVYLKGDISSQFCSALLLIAPSLPQGLTIHLTTPLISKPYIDMTLSSMRGWGIEVMNKGGTYVIPPHQSYQKQEDVIEGDFSSAGYFFAIAALTGSTITVENLNPSSAQADRKLLTILADMGHRIEAGNHHIRIKGGALLPMELQMEDCPDQVMTMAVLAAFAKGVTRISGVRSLRVKESERVIAVKNELGKMGIRTEDTHDTLTIYGGSPKGAIINTYNDHRIAMAFAVAGLALPGMAICHPHVVNKTFPTFWELLKGLG